MAERPIPLFQSGDRARLIEGPFKTFEGDVDAVDYEWGKVIIIINIFGKSVPCEVLASDPEMM